MSGSIITSAVTFCPINSFGWVEPTEKNIAKVVKIHKQTCSHLHNEDKLKKQAASAIKTANFINLLGYVPFFFIGNVIGAMRIFYALSTPMKAERKLKLLARGYMELTGLSLLRLVIDLAAIHLQKKSHS